MKELSIEEKAKAYDEALKVLHKYDGANIMFSQNLKEEMFPELKESEDERIRKYIINHLQEHLKTVREFLNNGMSAPFSSEEIKMLEASAAWLEKQCESNDISGRYKNDYGKNYVEQKSADEVEQNLAWSEEDINMFGSILSTLGICANNPQIPADVRSIYKKEELWFNELYHRAQPKREWSEDDENKLQGVIATFEGLYDCASSDTVKDLYFGKITFLKSLKERYTWKPSDEQMFDLKCAADSNSNVLLGQSLLSLYNNLKKLKEE